MITDEQLDGFAQVLIPRLDDLARRWNEGTWQLPKPPTLGDYHNWTRRQMVLPVQAQEDTDV